MKKIAMLCVLCILLSALPALAQNSTVDVQVTDLKNDIITISGEAPNDKLVTVLILNPDYTFSDIKQESAIQHFGAVLSKNGTFRLKVKMNAQEGGEYRVVVQTGGEKIEETSFSFYPYELKSEYVTIIKNAAKSEELKNLLPDIAKKFSLNNSDIYLTANLSDVAKTICLCNSSANIQSPEEAYRFLNEMFVLSAYNNKNPVLIKNGKLSYNNITGIDQSSWFECYDKELSESGINHLNKEIMQGSYKNMKDISDRFSELMCYCSIMYYDEYGSDHIIPIIEKYEDEYKNAGFDVSLLKNNKNKREYSRELINARAKNIEELAEAFNNIFSGAFKNTSDRGIGGSKGSSGSAARPPVQDNDTLFADKKPSSPVFDAKFSDMRDAQWAETAVYSLAEKGIINGRTEEAFCPAENVTRAEFTKLISLTFDLPDCEADTAFTDVERGAWYEEYIKSAVCANIIFGYNNSFKPDDFISRQDAAVIIFRAMKKEITEKKIFADAGMISEYASDAVGALGGLGILKGKDSGAFMPLDNLTRAEAAQLIYNVLEIGVTK